MRKIDKSPNVPATLVGAPVPTSAAEVLEKYYKADDVRNQLMTDQGRKCAYCECRVRKAYNDVEHYRPKSQYFWLGHEWKNLLYACNECNRSFKKYHFPLRDESTKDLAHQDISREEPLIINPAEDDPNSYIRFRRYEAIPFNGADKGLVTIELFQLNNRVELVEDRKQIYEEFSELNKKLNNTKRILASPNLPQNIQDVMREIVILLQRSIDSMTEASTPYSGMLVSQI